MARCVAAAVLASLLIAALLVVHYSAEQQAPVAVDLDASHVAQLPARRYGGARDERHSHSTHVQGSWRAFTAEGWTSEELHSAALRVPELAAAAELQGAQCGAAHEPGAVTRQAPWYAPEAVFETLACAECVPAWEGFDCPGGDRFSRSPPPDAWALNLPHKYDAALQPAPARTALAQALFAHLHGMGCASWRRGVFSKCARLRTLPRPTELARHWPHTRFMLPQAPPLPRSHVSTGTGLPLCDAHNLSQLSDGFVEADTRLWTPRSCRLPYRFPHASLRRCLKGQRLLLVGDSVMRQFLGRTVALIRGQPFYVEHNYSPVDSYSFDGTYDEVRTHAGVDAAEKALRRGEDLPDGQFHAVRLGDTRLTGWKDMRRVMRAFQPTHLVLGTNYWISDPAESALTPSRVLNSLLDLLGQPGVETDSLRTVLWQEFPCQARGLWNGTKDWYEHVHGARNDAVVAGLQRMWPKSKRTQGLRLGFLPNCAVGRSRIAPCVVDTVHTACRWDPFPSTRGNALPVSEVKAAANLDCSDPVGFTAARVLLNELGCGDGAGE